jgi:hypothetical protein
MVASYSMRDRKPSCTKTLNRFRTFCDTFRLRDTASKTRRGQDSENDSNSEVEDAIWLLSSPADELTAGRDNSALDF